MFNCAVKESINSVGSRFKRRVKKASSNSFSCMRSNTDVINSASGVAALEERLETMKLWSELVGGESSATASVQQLHVDEQFSGLIR